VIEEIPLIVEVQISDKSEDVAKLIIEVASKSCQLDTAPTWLIKQCNGLLAPFIALLFNFNRSLSTGCFPTKSKHAVK